MNKKSRRLHKGEWLFGREIEYATKPRRYKSLAKAFAPSMGKYKIIVYQGHHHFEGYSNIGHRFFNITTSMMDETKNAALVRVRMTPKGYYEQTTELYLLKADGSVSHIKSMLPRPDEQIKNINQAQQYLTKGWARI